MASYGPLLDMWVGDPDHGIGPDVVLTSGIVPVHVEVQAPLWMGLDRVELSESARLVHVWEGDAINPNSILLLSQTWEVHPVGTDGLPRDAWYVAIAMGDSDMSPVFTPIDIPPIQLNDVVIGAVAEIDLGAIDLASAVGEPVVYAKTGAVHPYALTHPIWVDVDGNRDGIGGPFEPLGRVPEWFRGTPAE